jgi:hypothetical protein
MFHQPSQNGLRIKHAIAKRKEKEKDKRKRKILLLVIDLFKHVNHGEKVAIEGGVEKWCFFKGIS